MFCGDNLIFNNFNKVSLVKSLFNQNARLNVLEHYQTLSKIFSSGCFGIAATKIWETTRNVVELFYKNYTTDTHYRTDHKGKDVQKEPFV